MKINFKHIGKRAVSIILTIMMIVSTTLVGMVSTNAATTITKGTTLYLKPGSNWKQSTPRFAAYFFNSTQDYEWVNMTEVEGDSGVYQVTSPKDYVNIIFCRMNGSTTSNNWNSGTFWNQTSDLTFDGTNNLYTVADDAWNKGSGTWSSYTPPVTELTGISVDAKYTNDGTTWLDDTSAEVGGEVSIGSSTVDPDDGTTVTASPAAGYEFAGWTTSGSGTFSNASAASTTFKPAADNEKATASFKKKYTVSVSSSAGGTLTSDKTNLLAGDTYTLTVAPTTGYYLSKLTVNGTTVNVTNNKYTATATANITASATFAEKTVCTFTATSADTTKGTVSTAGGSYYSGDTVTVTATPKSGYKFTGWTVVSGTVPNDQLSKATLSFALSNSVEVKANFTAIPTYTFSAVSADTSMGTVSIEGGTYQEGATVTVTASGKTGYEFIGWTVLSGSLPSGTSTSNATLTFAISNNVSVQANFEEKKEVATGVYFLRSINNSDPTKMSTISGVTVYKSSTGYYVQLTADQLSTSNCYVVFSSSTSYTGMKQANSDPTNESPDYISSGRQNEYYVGNTKYSYPYVALKSSYKDFIDKVTISYNTSTGKYTFSATSSLNPDSVRVYATDGIRGFGDTKITEVENTVVKVSDSSHTEYMVAPGTYIDIQTTMNVADTTGYYVYGYNINGKTYLVDSVTDTDKNGKSTYLTTYYVTGDEIDYEAEKTIEITPVYFNHKIEDAGDYITVYVDPATLRDESGNLGHWGNMISCYSYYFDGSTTYDGDGSYPGQVMLLDSNNKYFIKVAKYYYDETGTRKTSGGNPIAVSGVTFNSFTEENLHGSISGVGTNYQTYDYDDFKDIAALGYDTVEFEMKYETKKSHQSTVVSNANDADNASTSYSFSSLTTFNDTNGNGWETLTDYDDNPVDILGNLLTDEEKSNEKIYVISVGNQDTQVNRNSNSSLGKVGKWSTVWYVYKYNTSTQKYTYVTRGVPSDFIPAYQTDSNGDYVLDANGKKILISQSAAYDAIISNNLKGHPVEITYEKELNAGTSIESANTGVRLDGRWYYALEDNVEIPVNVTVQYKDSTDVTEWITDTNGTSGCLATIDGETSKIFTERNKDATLNAIAGGGYVFVEWGMFDQDGNYTKLALDASNGTVKVDKAYNFVARFVKAQDGTVTITHEKYQGPGAVGGGGYYYASATLYDMSGNAVESVTNTQSAIVFTVHPQQHAYIDITLRTVCKGMNTFIDFYEYVDSNYQIIGSEVDNYGKAGTVEYSFRVYVSQIYDKEGINQLHKTFNFYSDIAPVTSKGVLNYYYTDRFGEQKLYVVNITLTEDDIVDGSYYVSDERIRENAPAVDDLYKDCTWVISDSRRNGTVVDLVGMHVDKFFTVNMVDDGCGSETTEDDLTTVYSKLPLNSFITKEENITNVNTYGFILPMDIDNFKYWLVIDTHTGREVAKCYTPQFNLRIAGDYTVTAMYSVAEDSVTINDPTYTREQYTNADGSNAKDYLYADFILAYMPTESELIRDNPDKYQTGIIVQFDTGVKVSQEDIAGSKLNETIPTFNTNDALLDETMGLADGKNTTTTTGTGTLVSYNFVIDNTQYNNFNRVSYFVKFKNTYNYRHYAMKAYYYVNVLDDNGNVVDTIISDPVYFCLYEIGNSVIKSQG